MAAKHRQKSGSNGRKKQNKVQRYFDYSLLFVVIFLVCFGLVMIYSTSSYSSQVDFGDSFHYLKRQFMWAGIGFLGLLLISRIDYHLWSKFAFFGYIVMNLMLMAVLIIGFTASHGRNADCYRAGSIPAF